jgi:hypothetical protein
VKVKNVVYPEVGLNIVMVHGVLSDGKDFDEMAKKFASDDRLKNVKIKVSVVKYGKLLLSVGRIPFVRKLVSRYIAARLAACTYKYPNAKTVVLAHSFGTWAVAHAIKELYKEFRLDMLILAGSVIPRNFPWHKYGLWVNNFVGRKDFVVFMSALWGTGWSGRFGFKRTRMAEKVFSCKGYSACDNLSEYYRDWGHTDYRKGYDEYVGLISDYLGVEALRK